MSLEELRKLLKENENNRILKLKNKKLSLDMIKILVEFWQSNTSITSIDLRGNKIRDEGTKSLAEAIKDNTSLTSINLSSNNIGAKEVEEINKLLAHNKDIWNNLGELPALHQLCLTNNQAKIIELLEKGIDIDCQNK